MRRNDRHMHPLLLLAAAVLLSACARGPRSAYQMLYQNRLAGVRVPSYEEIAAVQEAEEPEVLGHRSQQVWDACLGLAAQSKGILGLAEDTRGGHHLLLISGESLAYKRDLSVFVERWLAISVRPRTENSSAIRVAFVSPKTARVAPFSTDSFPKGFVGDDQRSVSEALREDFMLALSKTLGEDAYLSRLEKGSRSARGVAPSIGAKQSEKRESMAQHLGNFQSAIIRRDRFVLNVPRLENRIAALVNPIVAKVGRRGEVQAAFSRAAL